MAHKRKGQLTVSGEWARHLRPWHRREFWKAERQAQRLQALAEALPMSTNNIEASTARLLAVFTTTPSREEARKIAQTLVERQLVACAQISEIESIYSWKGAVQREPEFRLLLKTTEPQYEAVETVIRELHSYELPAIFAMAIEHAYEPYARWVQELSCGQEARDDA